MQRLAFRAFLLTFALGFIMSGLGRFNLVSFISRHLPTLLNDTTEQQVFQGDKTAAPPSADKPKWIEELKLRTNTLSEKEEGFYSLEAEYPQIAEPNSDAARHFNRSIKSWVLSLTADFRQHEASIMRQYSHENLFEESLVINYEVIFSNQDLISLRFTDTVMATGMMHPVDYYISKNYDLKSGRWLQLSELFKPRTEYLRAISAYCLDELRKTYGLEGHLIEEGAAPQTENYDNWNITPEGIFISFEDYQVGPHSMGQPELTVPYAVLKDLVVKKSLLTLSNASTH